MAYKIGDIVEIVNERGGKTHASHGFRKGEQVRVTSVYAEGTEFEHYKCDSTGDGRRRSWYVNKRDLVKRRKGASN